MLENKLNMKKKGFTLAEILITIGIIGVIAVITLTGIYQKYQASVVETRLQKFYADMNNVIRLSEFENGDKTSWETSNVDTMWDTYFAPYIKDKKKLCKVRNMYAFERSDGSIYIIENDHVNFYTSDKCFKKCSEYILSTRKNELAGFGGKCLFQFGILL